MGSTLGESVGMSDGWIVGETVGTRDGWIVGNSVGVLVGSTAVNVKLRMLKQDGKSIRYVSFKTYLDSRSSFYLPWV